MDIYIYWVVVKIMVLFWVPIIIRHLWFRVPKKGPQFWQPPIYTYIYFYFWFVYTYIYIQKYTHMCRYRYVCTHLHLVVYVHTYIFTQMYICIHMCRSANRDRRNIKVTGVVGCGAKMGGKPRTPKNCTLKGMSVLQPGTPKGAAMVRRNWPQAQAHTPKGMANR